MEFDANTFNQACEAIRNLVNSVFDSVWPIMPRALDLWLDVTFLGLCPGPIRSAAQKVLKWCYDMLQSFVNSLFDVFESMWVPLTAALRGAAWNTEGNKLFDRRRDVQDAVTDVGRTWTGPAATAFASHAKEHTDKLEAMQTLADEMRNQCFIVAGAGLTLYLAIAKVVADTVSTAAAASASTAVDGPAGPAAAGAAGGLGATGVVALLAGFAAIVGPIATAYTTLGDKTREVARSWPEPGSFDYSDGSASDGDESGWSTER